MGGIFNPTQVNRDAPSYVNCTPENAEVCAIGDLSRKHGLLDIADAPGSNSFFFTDTTVDLMGQNSVIGNTIVIYESDENSPIVACAPLEVVTTLSIWDIFGEFSAFSDSFYIDTFARTSLDTSQLTLLSFVVAPNQLCHVALTSPNVSVYNPFDVTTPRGRAITPDQLAVGDISGKNFTSPGILPEFPIHGISTTALRSLGYRIGDGDNYQEVCTALMPLYQVPTMLMAKASFEGSVSGAIYFVCYQSILFKTFH